MTSRACLSLLLLVPGLLALLGGCAEGGIGGTGTIIPPTPPIGMSGAGNKGPFAAGADVSVISLQSGTTFRSTTSGALGAFSISLQSGEANRVEVAGDYFSENLGEIVDANVALRGIVVGQAGASANINVATHLISKRVETLLNGGMDNTAAISTAQSELLLALGGVLPAPGNPVDFNTLVTISASQATVNDEGNAWLLALSATLEAAALAARTNRGTTLAAELTSLLDGLAADLAADGTIEDEPALAGLQTAVTRLNPDVVHGNLLRVDPSLRINALTSLGQLTSLVAETLNCHVFGSQVLCAALPVFADGSTEAALGQINAAGNIASATFPLSNVIADMNRFIDTDGDGLVNVDDDDDDNDGIADAADPKPYEP